MSVTEMLFPSQDSPTGFPEPDSARVTLKSKIEWSSPVFHVIAKCHYLSQPSPKIVATFPVGEVVDQDDPVHSVEEDMPGVPLAVAAPNVPQLNKERFLLLRSLLELVQLHLQPVQGFILLDGCIVVFTSIEQPTVQDGLGSAVS